MTDAAPLTKHPAKFSDPILDVLDRLVQKEARRRRAAGAASLTVVDPFAGVGRIHRLARPPRNGFELRTLGLEIEEPWAACHRDTLWTDAIDWLAWVIAGELHNRPLVQMYVTSPTYGNRYSDHHDAQDGSVRHSYTHYLGRQPTKGSSAVMPWGPDYWEFTALAYRMMLAAAEPDAPFVLNVSDFVRGRELVPAAAWHLGAAIGAGWLPDRRTRTRLIPTARHRHGANHEARAPFEVVYSFRKAADDG